ncbi:MAG TPA: response regulator transcription factor [Actinomycetota bacterium]
MRVLVVDDNDDIALLIERALGLADIASIRINDGRAAAATVTREHPDVVVLDVQMRDFTGWEALEELRSDGGPGADVPVLMCTVKSSPEDLVRGYELGCDGYLTKPFSINELTERVRALAAMSVDERHAARKERLEEARAQLDR